MAKEVGLETMGFFMLGLPDDTIETMKKTIDFAIELEPDIPKTTILTPYPGTNLFDEWSKKGYIKSRVWSEYSYHTPYTVYVHPTLDWDVLKEYYNLFYRRTYLNSRFILRRLRRGIETGELLHDVYYFFRTLRYGW